MADDNSAYDRQHYSPIGAHDYADASTAPTTRRTSTATVEMSRNNTTNSDDASMQASSNSLQSQAGEGAPRRPRARQDYGTLLQHLYGNY